MSYYRHLHNYYFTQVIDEFTSSGFGVKIYEDTGKNTIRIQAMFRGNNRNIDSFIQGKFRLENVFRYQCRKRRDGTPRRNLLTKKIPSPRGSIIIRAKLIKCIN